MANTYMKVEKFMEEIGAKTNAITFIVCCMGEQECFIKEEIDRLNRFWGNEEVDNYFMLNTHEMMIVIK